MHSSGRLAIKGKDFPGRGKWKGTLLQISAVCQLSTCLSTVAMNALRERHPIAIKVATRKHNSFYEGFLLQVAFPYV